MTTRLAIALTVVLAMLSGCAGKANTAARGAVHVVKTLDNPLDIIDWVLEQAADEDEEEGQDDAGD